MPPSAESRIANTLNAIGKALFPRGTVKDSVVWDDGERAAWIMDARRLSRIVGDGTGMTTISGEYTYMILRSLGIKDRMFEYERGPMAPSDFLDRMKEVVHAAAGVGDDVYIQHLTFIPEPGYPWPEPYYSQKKGRVVQGERPWWIAEEPIKDLDGEMRPGLDFCKFIGPLRNYEVGAEVLKLGREQIVLTHAMGTMSDLTRRGSWDANADAVNACGGLLFPSLAIGVPATNFGPFVMVADVGFLTRSLKPGRRRGDYAPAQVYDTDVWTMTTSTFSREAAISAFDQLTGDDHWIHYLDVNVWSLGLPANPDYHSPSGGSRLERMAQLKREYAARRKLWPRSLSPERQHEVYESHLESIERYPYLEAKVNGVMAMSSFPMAVQPEQASDGFARFLEATGFRGKLLSVELPDEVAQVMDPEWAPEGMPWPQRSALRAWAERQYGWHVQDAILEHGRVFE